VGSEGGTDIEEPKYTLNKTKKKDDFNARDIKNQAYMFLKEFLNEIQDVTRTFLKYSNKLEDKFIKNPKISQLIQDPHNIFVVLEENMEKNNKTFLDNIKRDLEDHNRAAVDTQSSGKDLLLHKIYNQKVALHSVEKMCEESLNIKNALNLLDMNLLLNTRSKDKELNYEYVKIKAHENNEGISDIINNAIKVLNYSDVIQLDSKSQIVEPKQLYSRIIENYQSMGGNTSRVLDKKNNMRLQVYELLKENGGFRISLNNLLYILYKYNIIIEDLSQYFE